MKIGLDLHNVIDRYPKLFKELSEVWNALGHEIHIVTGQEKEKALPAVEKAGIAWHKFYSIVDYHKEIGTKMYTRTDKAGWWMDKGIWNSSKGDYAIEVGLDVHFDDSYDYAQYFPSDCTYIHVANGFDKMFENLLKVVLDE